MLTDIRMPPTDTDEGIQAAERLRETTRRSGSSYSASTRPDLVLALLEGGSARRAYLLKERVRNSTGSSRRSMPWPTVAR